ncbi:hypothetical protein YC2023_108598 [Brassica napus]
MRYCPEMYSNDLTQDPCVRMRFRLDCSSSNGKQDGEDKVQYSEIDHLAMVPAKAPIRMHLGQSDQSGQYGENHEPRLKTSERPDLHAGSAPCTDPWTADVRGCLFVSLCVGQKTQDVRGCPSVHISTRCSLDSACWPSPWTVWVILADVGCLFSTHKTLWVSASTHRTFVAVCGCPSALTRCLWLSVCVRVCPCVSECVCGRPSAHTGRLWLSISTHISTLVLGLSTLAFPVDCSGDFGTRGLSVQYTQDVRGCPSAHTGRLCVSVSTHRTSVPVRVCPCVSVSTHRTSVAVHQCTYQHVGPWTQHADPSRGLFGTHRTSVGVRQHTQDIRGCPLAHTGRPWLSVCVRQHTQDVRGCPSADTGRPTHISTMILGFSMLALPVDCLGDFGPRGLSVQYTQDVRGCPPAHAGRLWLFVAVRQHTHTHDVRGCPSVHISARCTHRTSVGVRQHTQNVRGCPWLSVSTHRTSVAVCGCPSVHISARWSMDSARWPFPLDCSGDFGPRRLSVQYTQAVRGCPLAHTGRPCVSVSTHRTSMAVRVCPSAYTGRPWLSISTHISTLVLGLNTLTLPVDCSGDFGPCGQSVQYTQDVCGCSPPHTGRPWLSEAFRQHTQDVCGCPCVPVCVCVCPSGHTRRPWVSVSTHRTCVADRVYTHQHAGPWTQHAGLSRGLFGTSVCVRQHTQDVRGYLCVSLCVSQNTQDVRGCPSTWAVCSVHTGRLWVSVSTHKTSVAVRGCLCVSACVCVCPSAHTGRLWLSISTHISTLYTQDVRGCPSAHTGRPCVSVSTHMTSVAVRVSPCVSVSTHRTSVAVHQTSVGVCQHTQDVRGCPCVQLSPSAHTERLWLSISTHFSTLVLGLSTLALPVDCLGDFGTRGLSVQYTQDVCGCQPAHTGRPWLSVITNRTSMAVRVCLCVSNGTHMTSVAVHQYTYQPVGPWTQHADPSRGCSWLSVSTHRMSVAVSVCPYVSVSAHKTFVGVRQHTQDVRVCLSTHTRCLWVSVSTHRTSVCVRQHTQDVCGCPCVSVCVRQHTQDVRGCPSVHISARWTSVGVRQHTQDVRSCPCVSVCVRLCPSAHTGRLWLSISTHISTLDLGLSPLALPVDCLVDFGPRGLSVQYTHNVCGCPSAHTGRLWLSVSTHRTSVAVPVCPSAHTGRPWLSISTHISTLVLELSTLVLELSTLALPVDCLSDFGPRGLSVQYTKDVRGCPPAHTRRPWLSVRTHRTSVAVRKCLCVSVCVRQHTQDVCGWPSVPISARWSLDSSRWPFPWTVRHNEDVRGCPCVSVGTHRTSVAVHRYTYQPVGPWTQHTDPSRGCQWLSVSTQRMSVASISTHISTLVLGLSTLTLPVDCSGDFGPRGQSVQYTQDVCGCQPAHTGRPWLSVSTNRTSMAVRVCLCVSNGTHRTSMAVHQYTYQPVGPWTQHADPSRDCSWLSVSTHRVSVAVRVCPYVSVSTHKTSVGVRQHTQDIRVCPTAHTRRLWLSVCFCVCPSAHTGRPWLSISTHIGTLVLGLSKLTLPMDCSGDFGPRGLSVHTHRTSVAVHQYTYQLVDLGLSPLAFPVDCLGYFGPRGLSVQYTQNVCGCQSANTGSLWLSVSTHRTFVAVPVCLSAHTGRPGCPSVHISARCTQRMSVGVRQHTQDVRGCPSAHTGRPWLSMCVCVCLCVSVSTHRTSVAVHQYTYQHAGPWTHHAGPSRGLFGMSVCVRQHNHDVCGCPSVSVGTHMTSVVHISACCTHKTSVGVRQHTQDVRVGPSVHISARWTSMAVRVCLCVSNGTHMTSVAVHQYTYQPVGPWTQHADPSRGCSWLSVSTHMMSVAVCVCSCVSVSTHKTSVGVRQHTQDVRVCPLAHTGRLWLSVCFRVCLSAHTGRPWLYISTQIGTLVLGLSKLTLPMDCSGYFGPRGLYVQYTQDVLGGPPAHTQDVRSCLCVSACVRLCPSAHTGRPWLSISTHISTLDIGLSPLALPVDCLGDFGPRGLSVQYTQNICGCPSAHTGRLCLSVSTHRTSVAVPVCLSAHTGRTWLSISTHISTLVLILSTLALPVDCLSDFGPRGLSVQYIKDVRGCPPAHTGRPWLSVSTHRTSVAVRVCLCVSVCVRQHTQDVCGCPSVHISAPWMSVCVRQHNQDVRGCPCVSVGKHRTSVAVHQYTYHPVGPWTLHTDPSRGCPWLSVSTHRMSVAVCVCPCVSVSTHKTSVGVRQHTRNVRVCPSAHTRRVWLSVCFRVCPSANTGRPWLSISTHIGMLVLGLSTLTLPVDCLAHTGCPWLSISTHISTLDLGLSPLALPVDCLGDFGPRGLSVQYTQDVCGCPPAHTGRLWLSVSTHRTSVAVCVCPSAHTGCPWLSISTHISMLVDTTQITLRSVTLIKRGSDVYVDNERVSIDGPIGTSTDTPLPTSIDSQLRTSIDGPMREYDMPY